ncbi:MAG: hypothetical protein LBP59_01470 [Planctomycetaceae bacterium]|jgi:hypothetical protein|nr:hypothetical protein [Planctomycetaceae bacterium]
MNIFDRYFMYRIDCALDDAQPLDVLTAWYVRRRPNLSKYYAEMLQLEIELCFPNIDVADNDNTDVSDADISDKIVIQSNSQKYYQSGCERQNQSLRQNYYGGYWKKQFWLIVAASILFIALAAAPFMNFLKQQFFPDTQIKNFATINENQKEQKIDLANIVDELFFSSDLLSGKSNNYAVQVGGDNSLEVFVLDAMVDPVVNFTESPLETTLTLLQIAGVVKSKNHEQNNKM